METAIIPICLEADFNLASSRPIYRSTKKEKEDRMRSHTSPLLGLLSIVVLLLGWALLPHRDIGFVIVASFVFLGIWITASALDAV